MKITFAHMGTLSIVLETLFQSLGHETVMPPPISKRTLELGTQYAPETVCLPFKLTLGNFIEALEQGADTIVTCGGVGPCRLGYYAEVQRGILEAMGFSFAMIVVEPSLVDTYNNIKKVAAQKNWLEIYKAFRIAGEKLKCLDGLEKKVHFLRPHAVVIAEVEAIWKNAIAKIHTASNITTIQAAADQAEVEFGKLQLKKGFQPLKVGFMGEIYVTLEPFINQDIELKLGSLGVEVAKTMFLSDYVRGHLLKERRYLKLYERLDTLAKPYLGHYVGGHALNNIGWTVSMGQKDFDGMVHVYPFTCMPEVVAKNILPQVSQDMDIPILSLAFDEQTGDAGVITRLEAFVDLLRYRQSQKNL